MNSWVYLSIRHLLKIGLERLLLGVKLRCLNRFMAQMLLYVFQANAILQQELAYGVPQTMGRHPDSFQPMPFELLIDQIADLMGLEVIKQILPPPTSGNGPPVGFCQIGLHYLTAVREEFDGLFCAFALAQHL